MKWSLFLAPRIPDERWRVSAGFCREQKHSFKQHVYWYWSFHKLLIVLVILPCDTSLPKLDWKVGGCGTIGSSGYQPHIELVPYVPCDFHFICVHRIRKRSSSVPLHIVLFWSFLWFPSFTPVVACFVGVLLAFQCICLLELGLRMQTHAWCVCLRYLCVCVSVLSLYRPPMYSATYIFPFQVLQVLLTSQTLGTCSWACRVWMGILTKGHKSEPMYSHR